MKLFILIVIALFIPNILLIKRRFRKNLKNYGLMSPCEWKIFGSECSSGLVCSTRKNDPEYKCRAKSYEHCSDNEECENGLVCIDEKRKGFCVG